MKLTFFSQLWRAWQHFWFKPVSVAGFGLMRVAFGLCCLTVYGLQMSRVWYYYSDKGIFPTNLVPIMLRHDYRFSLLDSIHTPFGVSILYSVMIAALICVTIGFFTRTALIVTTVLMFSFQEYSIIMLDGSDTMLRLICFLLVLAPSGRTFSVDTVGKRIAYWQEFGHDQPAIEREMPIWPYRLLLWQLVCLYVSSAFGKMKGDMWWNGSAVGSVLLHPWFSRLPADVVHAYVEPISPFLTAFTVIAQICWSLLIILPLLRWIVPTNAKRFIPVIGFRRLLIVCGVLLHSGIAIFMDVGVFSFTMMTVYLGLLIDEDFVMLRRLFNGRSPKHIVILYDGDCRLCVGSIATLSILDWLGRLKLVDFRDAKARKRYAPTTSLATLSHAMHAKKSNGTFTKGFFAFRSIAWYLPIGWFLAPFLYLPGMAIVGSAVYDKVAANRVQCRGGNCKITK